MADADADVGSGVLDASAGRDCQRRGIERTGVAKGDGNGAVADSGLLDAGGEAGRGIRSGASANRGCEYAGSATVIQRQVNRALRRRGEPSRRPDLPDLPGCNRINHSGHDTDTGIALTTRRAGVANHEANLKRINDANIDRNGGRLHSWNSDELRLSGRRKTEYGYRSAG
ncbi:MAG: hypothetical protein ABIW16_01645 [Sphingomicrobium sp.]